MKRWQTGRSQCRPHNPRVRHATSEEVLASMEAQLAWLVQTYGAEHYLVALQQERIRQTTNGEMR